jgi:hypothetical protein
MKKIIIASALLFTIFSCKKASEILEEIEKDQIMAEDNSIAEKNSDDASIMSDEAFEKGELTSRGGNETLGGAKITKDSTKKKITIDFGTGVLGKDGKVRTGMIIITYTGGYNTTGSIITQTFSNYTVNGHSVAGTRTITNSGNDSWAIVAALTITKSNGKVITWNSTRTRTKIATGEFNITGSANGTTSNGDTYTITIGTPLLVKLACDHIQGGTITYTRGTKSATIDYGYGSATPCDNQAEVTRSNGTKKVITL